MHICEHAGILVLTTSAHTPPPKETYPSYERQDTIQLGGHPFIEDAVRKYIQNPLPMTARKLVPKQALALCATEHNEFFEPYRKKNDSNLSLLARILRTFSSIGK